MLKMEEKNMGRPNTYSAIITTRLRADAMLLEKRKSEVPTQLGFDVTGILSEYFGGDIVDVEFTGELENQLRPSRIKGSLEACSRGFPMDHLAKS